MGDGKTTRREALAMLGVTGLAVTVGCGGGETATSPSAVYGSGVYSSKGQDPTSNAGDNVFADSLNSELATLSGDTTNGYTASFQLGISI